MLRKSLFDKINIKQNQVHYLFLFLSIIVYFGLIALWHCFNHALPSSDAVAYLSDSYTIYNEINGPISFLHHMYFDRGWRPQMFPIFAVPFLLISNGNAIFAVAAVSLIFSVIFITYLYLLFRIKLEPVYSFLASLFICSSGYLFTFNLIFFSEISYIAFVAAAFYHLLRSDFFSHPKHSVLSGIFIGLALCIRPAEAVMLAVVIFYFMIVSFMQKKTSLFEIWSSVNVCLATILLLFYANYVIGFHKIELLPALALIFFATFQIKKYLQQNKYSLFIFILALNIILFAYWLPAIPALINWSIEASVGSVVKSLAVKSETIPALISHVYYAWQQILLPLFIMFPLALLMSRSRNFLHPLALPLFAAITLMTVITIVMFSSVVNDGQVARRTLTIVILLNILLLAFILDKNVRFRIIPTAIIGLLTFISYLSITSTITGVPALYPKKIIERAYLEQFVTKNLIAPDRRPEDKHISLMKKLKDNTEKYGLTDKTISMLLLDDLDTDYWDPFTGSLAARIVKTPFHVGFIFVAQGQDTYEITKQRNANFFLLDEGSHFNENRLKNNNKSVTGLFTSTLIQEYRKGKFTRTKLVDVIDVDGRKALLLQYSY